MNPYEKTLWKNGDLISADKMNKIEEQLDYLTENGGSSSAADSVLYIAQELTDAQKEQARENIGAINKAALDDITQDMVSKKSRKLEVYPNNSVEELCYTSFSDYIEQQDELSILGYDDGGIFNKQWIIKNVSSEEFEELYANTTLREGIFNNKNTLENWSIPLINQQFSYNTLTNEVLFDTSIGDDPSEADITDCSIPGIPFKSTFELYWKAEPSEWEQLTTRIENLETTITETTTALTTVQEDVEELKNSSSSSSGIGDIWFENEEEEVWPNLAEGLELEVMVNSFGSGDQVHIIYNRSSVPTDDTEYVRCISGPIYVNNITPEIWTNVMKDNIKYYEEGYWQEEDVGKEFTNERLCTIEYDKSMQRIIIDCKFFMGYSTAYISYGMHWYTYLIIPKYEGMTITRATDLPKIDKKFNMLEDAAKLEFITELAPITSFESWTTDWYDWYSTRMSGSQLNILPFDILRIYTTRTHHHVSVTMSGDYDSFTTNNLPYDIGNQCYILDARIIQTQWSPDSASEKISIEINGISKEDIIAVRAYRSKTNMLPYVELPWGEEELSLFSNEWNSNLLGERGAYQMGDDEQLHYITDWYRETSIYITFEQYLYLRTQQLLSENQARWRNRWTIHDGLNAYLHVSGTIEKEITISKSGNSHTITLANPCTISYLNLDGRIENKTFSTYSWSSVTTAASTYAIGYMGYAFDAVKLTNWNPDEQMNILGIINFENKTVLGPLFENANVTFDY